MSAERRSHPVYVAPIPRFWWVRTAPFRRFVIRELTSVFVGLFSVVLLAAVVFWFLPQFTSLGAVWATVQAMTNSVKHAGGPEITRSVVLRGTSAGGVQSVISDDGAGFDPALIASERLGVRVSILERIRLVGGDAEIRTAPGLGTTITLSWPAASREAVEPVDLNELALG